MLPRPLRHLLLSIALFGSSLMAGGLLVEWAAPMPSNAILAAKLRHLEANPNAYDTLFFGSSRLFRAIVPRAFDAEMAARGAPTRSFNLALDGMLPHEVNAFLRTLLADRPEGLRFAVVELSDWSPLLPRSNRFGPRMIAWHDWSETRSVLHSTRLLEATSKQRFDLVSTHLLHWVARTLRVGQAGYALRHWLSPDAVEEMRGSASLARRGFAPFEEWEYREGFTGALRRRFLRSQVEYGRAVAGLRAANAAPASLDSYNLEALRAQITAIRAAGVEPVYVVPPFAEPTPELHRLGERGFVPMLLAFGDPVAQAELFASDHRFDVRHLNSEGALLFSRELARRLAERLAER